MSTDGEGTRRYDNSNRRRHAEKTAERIVDAGARLLRRSPIRDWHAVTIRAVAEEAGVSERTVYRHFGTEKGLRDAIMGHFEATAGVDLGSLGLHDLAEVAVRGLRFAADFPVEPEAELDPTLHETDERRRAALLHAISASGTTWDADQQRRAAAVVDLLWNFSAYERFRSTWRLDPDAAIDAIRWAVGLVVAAAEAPEDRPARSDLA